MFHEMSRMLASIYTYALLVLVLLATALPLFTEEWLERKLLCWGVQVQKSGEVEEDFLFLGASIT